MLVKLDQVSPPSCQIKSGDYPYSNSYVILALLRINGCGNQSFVSTKLQLQTPCFCEGTHSWRIIIIFRYFTHHTSSHISCSPSSPSLAKKLHLLHWMLSWPVVLEVCLKIAVPGSPWIWRYDARPQLNEPRQTPGSNGHHCHTKSGDMRLTTSCTTWRCLKLFKILGPKTLFSDTLGGAGFFCTNSIDMCISIYCVYIYMYLYVCAKKIKYIYMNIFIINSYHIWYRSDTQIIFRNMGDTDQRLLQVILSCLKNFSSRPTVCQFFANAYPVLWQPTRWTLKFDTTWNGKALSCPMIVLQAISLMLPRSKKVKCTRTNWLERIGKVSSTRTVVQKQTSNWFHWIDGIRVTVFHWDFGKFWGNLDLESSNWVGAEGLDSS